MTLTHNNSNSPAIILPVTKNQWQTLSVYMLAVMLTLATFYLRQQLSPLLNGRPLLIIFMLPVMVSALIGGFGPGIMATTVAAACSAYYIFPPINSFKFASGFDLLQWSLLSINGVLVSFMSELLHRSRNREVARWRQLAASQGELKQTDALLRQSQAQLKVFIREAPICIAMLDRNMNYLSVSGYWLVDYGRGHEDLSGLNHYDLHPDQPDAWKFVHQQALTGVTVKNDGDIWIRADGSRQWLRWTVQPWIDENGAIGGIIISAEDITRRKQVEEDIRKLNTTLEQQVQERTAELKSANRELDSFAYAVSHDLRAPLRAMSGFSRALIEDYGEQLQGEARVYLDQIGIASEKMSELIDGLLVLSRCTRGALHNDEINLSVISERLLAEMARNEPARHVEIQIEPGLIVRGDTCMIELVMQNLLSNAWKYTANKPLASIQVFAETQEGRRRFCVVDNGAGFDMAYANRLFQPFQRLHRQEEFLGIGIGLATVQRIVQRQGGTIEAFSESNKGARFSFSLPNIPADSGSE